MNLSFENTLEKELLRKHRSHFRLLFQKTLSDILHFYSLDFLHLTSLPFVREQALYYFLRYGVGPLPSRPLESFEKAKRATEGKLAALLGHESATLFDAENPPFSKVIQSLVTPRTLVIKHKHFAYSPTVSVETKILEANHEPQMRSLFSGLDKSRFDQLLILIESVSSRTGNTESIDAILDVSKKYKRTVVVDDTYACQVLGNHGMGLAAGKPGIDIIIGNLGKTFGFFASYLACSKELMDYTLSNRSLQRRPFTPFLLGVTDAILDLIPSMDIERAHILENAHKFRKVLEMSGYQKSESNSHLITIPCKTLEEARHLSLHLTDNGCIPNTIQAVNPNEKPLILRFFLTAEHTLHEIQRIHEILTSFKQLPFCESL